MKCLHFPGKPARGTALSDPLEEETARPPRARAGQSRLALGLLSALALLGLATACTAKNPAYEKQLGDLKDRVTILQNERDQLEERLAAIEQLQVNQARQRREPNNGLSRPPLKVVQLVPDAAEAPEDAPALDGAADVNLAAAMDVQGPASDEPRTLIHGSGSDLAQVTAPGSDGQ